MISNGLYHIPVAMLDGVQGGNQRVMVLRDGTVRGDHRIDRDYGDETAEGDGIALAGKQSNRFKSTRRLLRPD